eukprot:scaffold38863_cov63-Phaeocystis_antarctica.AAC.2
MTRSKTRSSLAGWQSSEGEQNSERATILCITLLRGANAAHKHTWDGLPTRYAVRKCTRTQTQYMYEQHCITKHRLAPLHGLCLAAAPGRVSGELVFPRRSRVQRRSPLEVRGRLHELRRRARPDLPRTTTTGPAQHHGPHMVGYHIVRRRPHHPRRQRLETLVVPPLRLGHLGAHLLFQHVDGHCRGRCPFSRASRATLLGLEEPLRGLHVVPRVGERCTEVVVRHGLVGPQCNGLAEGPGCSACVPLRGVPRAFSQQLIVRIARLRGVPGCLLRDLALPLLHHPSILRHFPLPLHLLVIHGVQLPGARVARAVDAAPVRRRHLQLDANRANFVLLTVVAHL